MVSFRRFFSFGCQVFGGVGRWGARDGNHGGRRELRPLRRGFLPTGVFFVCVVCVEGAAERDFYVYVCWFVLDETH